MSSFDPQDFQDLSSLVAYRQRQEQASRLRDLKELLTKQETRNQEQLSLQNMLYSLKLESGKLSALLHQHNYPAACKLLVNCQSKLAGLSHENFTTLEYKKLFADLSQYFEQLPSWLCENVPGGSSIWIKAQEQFIDEQKKQAACAVLASYSQKSRMAYVLLGLFLGYFGIHNFYAGYTGRGVAQLLLCLFSPMLLFIPLLVLFVWTLIEICIVTQDAQGLRFQ